MFDFKLAISDFDSDGKKRLMMALDEAIQRAGFIVEDCGSFHSSEEEECVSFHFFEEGNSKGK